MNGWDGMGFDATLGRERKMGLWVGLWDCSCGFSFIIIVINFCMIVIDCVHDCMHE